MENYVIKKKNTNKKLSKFNFLEEGYVFKPNIKNPNLIKITSLSITNIKITNSILKKKLEVSFRHLASLLFRVLESDEASSTDVSIALNELSKEKEKVKNKYQKFLIQEEQEKYLKRLKVLEGRLKEKLVTLRLHEEMVYAEKIEKSKSR